MRCPSSRSSTATSFLVTITGIWSVIAKMTEVAHSVRPLHGYGLYRRGMTRGTISLIHPATSSPDPFLYERLVRKTSHSGISMTPRGAMAALSATLLTLGEGRGLVRPVILVHDGEDWTYRRFPTDQRATCKDGIVQWH
jgi:hypothetical protein